MKLRRILFLCFAFILTSVVVSGQNGDDMEPEPGPPALEPFPGWQGHELEHNIILPQVAVGDDITMTLIFTNLGGSQRMGWFENDEDYDVTGTLRFFATDGSPMQVDIGGVIDSEFPLSVSGNGVSYMEISAPLGSGQQIGWLLIDVEDGTPPDWGFMDGDAVQRGERIAASAYYSILDQGELASQVAVTPTTLRRGTTANAVLVAEFNEGTEDGNMVRTGVAMVNAGDQNATVNLMLTDPNGQETASNSVELGPGQQQALFVNELFPELAGNFQGLLQVSTDSESVVTMGLLQTGLVTTSIPVHHYGTWGQTQEPPQGPGNGPTNGENQ